MGVGGWGGGANIVQVHLHTYWMLSLLAHTNILPATLETFSPCTHTHTSFYTRDIFFSCAYIHTSCYARDIFPCTHTHTSFYARDNLLLHIHTYFMQRYRRFLLHIHTYFLRRYIHFLLHVPHTWSYVPIDIFSCTYIYTYILYATLQFYRCLLLHIHTEEKKTFFEALPCKTQCNVTMGLQNPWDFQGAILTWQNMDNC